MWESAQLQTSSPPGVIWQQYKQKHEEKHNIHFDAHTKIRRPLPIERVRQDPSVRLEIIMKVKSVMYEDHHGRLERIHIEFGAISTFATVEITHDNIMFYCFRGFYNAASSLRSMKHGKQYTLALAALYDIETIDVPPVKRIYSGPTSLDELADPENCHTFRLVLRNDPDTSACEIRAHRDSRLHHRIHFAWHTHLQRDSTDLHIISTQYNASMDFYQETINAINSTAMPHELCEVLNDFANEVIMDVTLKTICFKSRELFLVLFRLYNEMTTATPTKLLQYFQDSRKKKNQDDIVMLQQQTLLNMTSY